ncbi:UNVERIFIED_CONTAM: hypothetical protein FKN15_012336 [Acipenser sinensis]
MSWLQHFHIDETLESNLARADGVREAKLPDTGRYLRRIGKCHHSDPGQCETVGPQSNEAWLSPQKVDESPV